MRFFAHPKVILFEMFVDNDKDFKKHTVRQNQAIQMNRYKPKNTT